MVLTDSCIIYEIKIEYILKWKKDFVVGQEMR